MLHDEGGSKYEVSVFNVRTSNAWALDLALTMTYFPHCNLKFAVVFGCNSRIQKEILDRLVLVGDNGFHPLLLPGIIVEIERKRHAQMIDDIADEFEARIFQLEVGPDAGEGTATLQMEKLHKDRRSAWLNITYTRNCLVSWRKQLENIALHVDEVSRPLLSGYGWLGISSTCIPLEFNDDTLMREEDIPIDHVQSVASQSAPYLEQIGDEFLTTGYKIKSRT
ncbi:hypothetical protein F5Y14DRAFT_454803 [Nemania sp. NC0429]|nr:hypothetical protein F5Y14DRAFT_454803 [Nemania sp. NC0429]